MKLIYPIGYIATIFAANWAIVTFGVVPVGFGLVAPAAVVFAGLALSLRDLVQDTYGRAWVFVAISVGAVFSYLIAPAFAVASFVAFFVSELIDMTIYTPLRKRNWYGAVLVSNAVGLVLDSVLFLWLAFRSLDFLAGQIVGKTEVTLVFLGLAWLVRNRGLLPR